MILYLFDIDGTLLHAHGSGRGAFDAVMAELHGVAGASAGTRFGGKTDPAIVDEIFVARLGRAPTSGERAAFLDAYVPRLRAALAAQGVVVLGGVVETLQFLSRRAPHRDSLGLGSARAGHSRDRSPSVRLGVATGNLRAGADAKLAAGGLDGWFEIGGYGCDSAVRAELVAAAIRRAPWATEVIVVGDTIHDIAAARACGATVCAVATGADPADRLGHADAVFASMAELPAWHAARFG